MRRMIEHALNLELSTRTRTRIFRVWLAVFTALMLWAGLTALVAANRASEATHAIERSAELDDARQCVNAWGGRADLRDMAEKGYRRNAQTLIGFVANPDLVARYKVQVEQDVEEIRATLPNPDCDLDAARRRLG